MDSFRNLEASIRLDSICSLVLNLEDCSMLEIGDCIALIDLTHFSIYDGLSVLKCVANVMMLHNLQVLKIIYAVNLERLPYNLDELRNLTHHEISSCSNYQVLSCLPDTIFELSKLSTLIKTLLRSFSSLAASLLSSGGCVAVSSMGEDGGVWSEDERWIVVDVNYGKKIKKMKVIICWIYYKLIQWLILF